MAVTDWRRRGESAEIKLRKQNLISGGKAGSDLKSSNKCFIRKTLIHLHLQSKIKLFYFYISLNYNYLSV